MRHAAWLIDKLIDKPIVQANIHKHRWLPSEGVETRQQGIYLLHGTGEHAARYEPLAKRLCAAGFRVGAHDHPGHGRSGGKRGVIDPAGALVTQAAIQCQQFAAETGCAPVLFGHSLGGLAATELVLQHALPVAGLILSAPAFVLHIRRRDILQVKLFAKVSPGFTVERPYDASRLTSNETIRKQAEADPLNHGFRSAGLVNWIMTSGAQQLASAAVLNVDTLLLIAGDDPVVNSVKTREFADAAPRDVMTVREYDGLLHEILNERPERVDQVLGDIEAWLLQRFIN